MISALVIGFAFGWTLERAGLGSARKLAGQFYLTDFTVIRVMMTAIVTAMLGVFWLGRAGLVDVTRLYVPDTFVWPQLAGGALFGAGFLVAGLCPGTSCVAAATGRKDGLMVVGGLFLGVVLTGLAVARVPRFYGSTPLGPRTLPETFHLPTGIVLLIVTAMALALFAMIERRQRTIG